MRVLICGGRDWKDYDYLENYLDNRWSREVYHTLVVIEGDARGADRQAGEWAESRSIPVIRYPADWTLGKVAGYERNKRMLTEGRPDLVIAFPGGKGTEMMIKLARVANVPVEEVTYV
jgi:hypothetical protein